MSKEGARQATGNGRADSDGRCVCGDLSEDTWALLLRVVRGWDV